MRKVIKRALCGHKSGFLLLQKDSETYAYFLLRHPLLFTEVTNEFIRRHSVYFLEEIPVTLNMHFLNNRALHIHKCAYQKSQKDSIIS